MKMRLAPFGIRKPVDIGDWAVRPITCEPGFKLGRSDHYQIELGRGVEVFEAAKDLLMTYTMFPSHRLQALIGDGPKIRIGSTVMQHARLGIFEFAMANRIVDVFDRQGDGLRVAGFTLASIQGHAEQGIETFKVVERGDGRVELHIDAQSRPGHWMTRLAAPLTRGVQVKASRECLENVRRVAAP